MGPIISRISGVIWLVVLSLLYFSLRLSFKRLLLLSKNATDTMEYYGAIKRNGTLVHATTRTDRENTVLRSGRSRSRKRTCCGIPLPRDVQKRPSQSDGGTAA